MVTHQGLGKKFIRRAIVGTSSIRNHRLRLSLKKQRLIGHLNPFGQYLSHEGINFYLQNFTVRKSLWPPITECNSNICARKLAVSEIPARKGCLTIWMLSCATSATLACCLLRFRAGCRHLCRPLLTYRYGGVTTLEPGGCG